MKKTLENFSWRQRLVGALSTSLRASSMMLNAGFRVLRRAFVSVLKPPTHILAFSLISILQIPMLVLSQMVSALGSALAWSLKKPVILDAPLCLQTSSPIHRWAKVEGSDDEGMVVNEFFAAEELVRSALFGDHPSDTATLHIVSTLRTQGFDGDEISEWMAACRQGDLWAIRRLVDWIGDAMGD